MKNNIFYKQLEQIAINGNYTIAQIKDATHEQVVSLLGVTDFSQTFFENMKRVLMRRLQTRNDETDRQFLIGKVDIAALKATFPDIVFEKGREQGFRKITIWLDGKPYE